MNNGGFNISLNRFITDGIIKTTQILNNKTRRDLHGKLNRGVALKMTFLY